MGARALLDSYQRRGRSPGNLSNQLSARALSQHRRLDSNAQPSPGFAWRDAPLLPPQVHAANLRRSLSSQRPHLRATVQDLVVAFREYMVLLDDLLVRMS